MVFFDTIATFIQNIAGLTILAGKNVAQVSNGISNPVVVGIIYWMIRILISGGCLVGVGILLAFIEIKIAGLYKKYCWDMITIMVILVSMAIAIYFADSDKDNITSQSTVSIVIGTGNICRDKMVCERLAGKQGDITKTYYTMPKTVKQ